MILKVYFKKRPKINKLMFHNNKLKSIKILQISNLNSYIYIYMHIVLINLIIRFNKYNKYGRMNLMINQNNKKGLI